MGRSRFLIAGALISIISFTSCQRSGQNAPPRVTAPLPPPPAGELKYAGVPPAHPFAKQGANLFTRTVFETDGPGNMHIEVRDVLIPPHTKSTVEALPGPVVVVPASGKATLPGGKQADAATEGAIRSVPAGQPLELENSESGPAMVRLYVIRAR